MRRLADLLQYFLDLIDVLTVRGWPGTPLVSVDGTEVPVLIRPGIPYRNAVLFEILDIGAPLEEPKELVDDGAKVELFGRKGREPFLKVKAHLMAETA